MTEVLSGSITAHTAVWGYNHDTEHKGTRQGLDHTRSAERAERGRQTLSVCLVAARSHDPPRQAVRGLGLTLYENKVEPTFAVH